ncbi:hypothetical protein C8R45DRAFT_970377 [Mycena sanguinolenta]|nr:hypothetical protein C8R45DRAFT_970377 [Mycena sanguinolenta]
MSVATASRRDPRSNAKGKRKTTSTESAFGSPQTFISTTSTEQREGWERTRESVARALADVIPDAELAKHDVITLVPEGVGSGVAENPIRNEALRSAAGQLLVIWNGVQAVQFSRLACLRLVERSANIFHSVLEESHEVGEGVLDQPIEKFLVTLNQITELLAKLVHQPFLKRYMKREETLHEIEKCHTLLTESVTMFSMSLQIRVLRHIRGFDRARSYDAEELKKLKQQLIGVVMPTAADLPSDLDIDIKNLKPAAGDTQVLRAIVERNAVENKQDSVQDAADLRAVFNHALTQDSDFEMLRILQLDRENLLEAVEILQRGLEDAEAEVPPAYTPGIGPPEYGAIGVDQELIVGVIDALRRISETEGQKLPSPAESISSVTSLPDFYQTRLSLSSVELVDYGLGSVASLQSHELYDESSPLAEKRNERRYRLLLEHDFHASLSLALWNPTPVSIGAVGFLDRTSGMFVTLLDIPSTSRGAMRIKTHRYAKRTAAQRGFDMLTGAVSSWMSDTDSPSISHTYSHPLRKASYLMADPATCTYVEALEPAKDWFKDNVDSVIREYGPRHQIEKEDLRLVVSTLDAENYALFVNHTERDGQVRFDVFSSLKAGQPWGKFTIDPPTEGEPDHSSFASKVSIVGDSRKTLLIGCMRFRLDEAEPTTLGGSFMPAPISQPRQSPIFEAPLSEPPPLSMEIPRGKSLKVRRASDSKLITEAVEPLDSDTSESHFPQIYHPPNANHLPADMIAFRSADAVSLEKELAAGGTVLSVHSVPDAVAWVEAHYDEPLLCEIRARNFDGPLAIPLSPAESALAIFGSISDVVLPELARKLAQLSGFAVMVRPSVDNPIPNFDTDATPAETAVGKVAVGKVTRLRGGAGEDELGSEEIPKWEGKYHSETLDLRLKLNDVMAYDVNVCSFIKFKTQSMTNSNPAIFRPRPEVLSLVSLDVKLRRGETQLDRSFSNIGFLAHRPNSILKCDFLDVGFEPPDATLKRSTGQSTSVNGGGTFGLTGVVPSFTVTGGYTRGGSETVETADVKVSRLREIFRCAKFCPATVEMQYSLRPREKLGARRSQEIWQRLQVLRHCLVSCNRSRQGRVRTAC